MGNERPDWGRELGRRVLKGTTGKGGLLESGKKSGTRDSPRNLPR